MKLDEVNKLVNSLEHARDNMIKAQKKFEGTHNVENYINYDVLRIAIESINLRLSTIRNMDIIIDRNI